MEETKGQNLLVVTNPTSNYISQHLLLLVHFIKALSPFQTAHKAMEIIPVKKKKAWSGRPVNMTENKKKLRVLQVNLRTPKMCQKKSQRSSNVHEDSVPTGSKFNSTNSVACFLFKELWILNTWLGNVGKGSL